MFRPTTVSFLLLLVVPAVLSEVGVGVRELCQDPTDANEPMLHPSLTNLEESQMEEPLKCPIPTLTLMPVTPSLKRRAWKRHSRMARI